VIPARLAAACAAALSLAAGHAAAKAARARAGAGAAPPAGAPTAAAAAALVPENASAALLLDGATGTAGLREYLGAAAAFAPMLAPETAGADLARSASLNLLSESASSAAGVARTGARALVIAGSAVGLSAPVDDPATARRALRAWLGQAGTVRPTRRSQPKGLLAAGDGAQLRAGMVANVAGRQRWLAASGRGATLLVGALAHVGARKRDTPQLARVPAVAAALEQVRGPAVLWVRGSGPVLGAVLSLEASARGIAATGLALPSRGEALLAGAAPEQSCHERALLCARASLGPSAAPLLSRVARELLVQALAPHERAPFDPLLQKAIGSASGPAALSVDALDAAALAGSHGGLEAISFLARASAPDLTVDLPSPAPPALVAIPGGVELQGAWQLCLRAEAGTTLFGAPCPAAAAGRLSPGSDPELLLSAQLDTAATAAALSKLSPLDALRSQTAAAALAAHLLWGRLLAHSGPIAVEGRRAPGRPGAIALDLRWPLRGR
jgi:hypothetical protein